MLYNVVLERLCCKKNSGAVMYCTMCLVFYLVNCPRGYSTQGNLCYKFEGDRKNWDDAAVFYRHHGQVSAGSSKEKHTVNNVNPFSLEFLNPVD